MKCRIAASLMMMLALAVDARAAAPRVVASIKPLHALAAGVMEGVAVPDVLIKGGGSVHAYALRPSDAVALDKAEVVFWIGPALEGFLERPLGALAGKARVVALIAAPGVRVLSPRKGGRWEADREHGSSADRVDGHIWLDPRNASAVAVVMAETLSAADPANALRYRQNAVALGVKLDALDAELAAKLAPVKDKPYVVFHDAYHYFEARYALRAIGSITVSPDRGPGARRLADVQEKISTLGPACVFSEPQFEPKIVQTLKRGTAARTGVLDPEGSVLAPGPDLLFNLLRDLADNLVRCLTIS